MGIKDLWSILSPFCDRKPLFELEGKKVAIDLSCWVCESQNIAEYTVQPRMYLRNLYFRTCYLLLMNVNLVFVLEGKAPELKYKTIAARNALQFKGQKPKSDSVKCKDRSRFNHTLKQCEEMLRLMGLACVKGEGEAEETCAILNKDGLVDGIISQDSDCFAYGARTVYRNFSISQQGTHAAKGGSVDVYDLGKAEINLQFGRNKIIALALLCGSDYNDGVHGVGKDSVMKLFSIVKDDDILQRLRDWKNKEKYETLEAKISDKNLCSSCGHYGKVQSHTRKGCLQCGTHQGCETTKFKNERLEIKNELNMRSKALSDPNFPDENLINEFLVNKTTIPKLHLKWEKPDFRKFINFTVRYLQWEEIYSFQKFLPILTRWQLLNPEEIVISPKFIKKKRCLKGVASYEIIWEDLEKFIDLIPEEQLDMDLEKLWATIEPKNLVEKAYPNLVEAFENAKKPTTKRKYNKNIDEINSRLMNVSVTEKKKPKTLEAFLVQASTPKCKIQEFSFDMEQSNFGDEDDLDVSDIVDDIIKKKPLKPTDLFNLESKTNCSFFAHELIENDLFEETFNQLHGSDCDE